MSTSGESEEMEKAEGDRDTVNEALQAQKAREDKQSASETLDEAPAKGVIDDEGDAPEPSEPA